MIVVDASAVLELVLGTEAGLRLQRQVVEMRHSLHAPHLLDIEVAHVLRRYFLAGELSGERGAMALDDAADLRLQRYSHLPFLERIWQLRTNLTGYDAAYVALAEALDVPLVTADAKLARTAGHAARIEVL